MQTLQDRLEKLEAKHGKGHPNLQFLRDQIAAEKNGVSTKEMYVAGMVDKQPGQPPE